MREEIRRIMEQQAKEFYRKYGYPASDVYETEELVEMAKAEWEREKNSFYNSIPGRKMMEAAGRTDYLVSVERVNKLTIAELEDRVCDLIVKYTDERIAREKAEAKVEELTEMVAKLATRKVEK